MHRGLPWSGSDSGLSSSTCSTWASNSDSSCAGSSECIRAFNPDHTYLTWSTHSNLLWSCQQRWTEPLISRKRASDPIHIMMNDRSVSPGPPQRDVCCLPLESRRHLTDVTSLPLIYAAPLPGFRDKMSDEPWLFQLEALGRRSFASFLVLISIISSYFLW
jgi:hypothetical protein